MRACESQVEAQCMHAIDLGWIVGIAVSVAMPISRLYLSVERLYSARALSGRWQ